MEGSVLKMPNMVPLTSAAVRSRSMSATRFGYACTGDMQGVAFSFFSSCCLRFAPGAWKNLGVEPGHVHNESGWTRRTGTFSVTFQG